MIPGPAAVLLDRDGTINRKAVAETDYVSAEHQVELLPGVGRAIRRLNDAAVPLAVVTNQRGIALGRMTEDDLARVHARLDELFAAEGAHVSAYHHCPHAGGCDCRKPAPGLVHRAADNLGVPVTECVVVGDRPADVHAGRAAGARTIGLGQRTAGLSTDAWAADLPAAVDLILGPAALGVGGITGGITGGTAA